jgi:hypothetical protein
MNFKRTFLIIILVLSGIQTIQYLRHGSALGAATELLLTEEAKENDL